MLREWRSRGTEVLSLETVYRNRINKMKRTEEVSSAADFDFAASIRAADPLLKTSETEKTSNLRRDLLHNIAGAALLAAVFSLFCMAQEAPGLILYMMPGVILFFVITLVEALKPGRLRWALIAVAAVLLIASLIVFRGMILGGMAMLMNSFYDFAEEAQAYLYHRLPAGESATDNIGAAWVSCLLGLVMAMPSVEARRAADILLALAAMFAVAYYGMVPSWIGIGVMLIALILLVSTGNIFSALPLLLAALIVFGGIMLIDPGESYGISRMDENFRDRFAFHSSLLENQTQTAEEEVPDELNEEEEQDKEDNSLFDGDHGSLAAVGVVLLIAAAIAALVYLLRKRFKKRQAVVRAGIDSSDPKTAVTAMFPYSVRWLKACGIGSEINREEPFIAMLPAITEELSGIYTDRFENMYTLWKEAAYSDHAISEESRQDMNGFMKETIELAQDKCTTTDKIRIKLKYAL